MKRCVWIIACAAASGSVRAAPARAQAESSDVLPEPPPPPPGASKLSTTDEPPRDVASPAPAKPQPTQDTTPAEPAAGSAVRAEGRVHDGFFMRTALGLGYVDSRGHRPFTAHEFGTEDGMSPSGPESRSRSGTGLAADFALGLAFGGRWLIGVNLVSHMFPNVDIGTSYEPPSSPWSDRGPTTMKYTMYGLLIVFYPTSSGLNAGISSGFSAGYGDGSEVSGIALAPQLGYDVWFHADWTLGLVLRTAFSRMSTEAGVGGHIETANVTLASLAVALTYD